MDLGQRTPTCLRTAPAHPCKWSQPMLYSPSSAWRELLFTCMIRPRHFPNPSIGSLLGSTLVACFWEVQFLSLGDVCCTVFHFPSESNGRVYVPCSHRVVDAEHPAHKTGSVFVLQDRSSRIPYIGKEGVSGSTLRSFEAGFSIFSASAFGLISPDFEGQDKVWYRPRRWRKWTLS